MEWGLAVLLSGQIIWQVALLSVKLPEALGKGLNNSQAGTLEDLKKACDLFSCYWWHHCTSTGVKSFSPSSFVTIFRASHESISFPSAEPSPPQHLLLDAQVELRFDHPTANRLNCCKITQALKTVWENWISNFSINNTMREKQCYPLIVIFSAAYFMLPSPTFFLATTDPW